MAQYVSKCNWGLRFASLDLSPWSKANVQRRVLRRLCGGLLLPILQGLPGEELLFELFRRLTFRNTATLLEGDLGLRCVPAPSDCTCLDWHSS
jgi:hypothetical protein